MRKQELQALLGAHGLRPRRRLGQNFLCDPQMLTAIVDDAGIQEDELVLEVGTGPGSLTAMLADRARRVLSVEVDAKMLRLAREWLGERENLELIEGDILAGKNALNGDIIATIQAALEESGLAAVRLVANLPYSIATPLVGLLTEAPFPLRAMSILIQKEVAERFVAGPGSKDYGPISVLLSLGWRAEITRKVPRQVFLPPPKVESAVVRIERVAESQLEPELQVLVRQLARALFQTRRKGLRASAKIAIRKDPDLAGLDAACADCELDGSVRAERLAPSQFLALARALRERRGGGEG